MNPVTPVKLGKFKASKMIVSQSWAILKQDTELIWFPVMSGFVSLVAFIILGLAFFFGVMGGDINSIGALDTSHSNSSSMDEIGYGFLLLYYLIMFFITNYFLAGIYIIVDARLKGQNLSLGDGIRGANRNLGKILAWSLISATVGVILQIIADKFKIIGAIVASVLGAAWAILTYFSLPSLIIGQRSVTDSFKESAALIRKTWGETIIVNFGVGLFFTLLIAIVFVLCVVIAIALPYVATFIILGIVFVLFLVAITIISSTLGSIFKLALYQFALTGQVPQGFAPELVHGAVKAGK